MNYLNLFFVVILATITINLTYASSSDTEYTDIVDPKMLENDDLPSDLKETSTTSSLRGSSRFLAQKGLPSNYTCDKFPRVCGMKSSTGSDCCKKKCVDIETDRLNCGMCGYKCKYSEICCKGKCVNSSFDRKNCGGCKNKCRKGEICAYGMCNYS